MIHMSHTWGPPPPYSSNVHVYCNMWHMWATREGSPPPYSSNVHVNCHMWHTWHMLATHEGSPPPYSSNVHVNCHMWHMWATCEGTLHHIVVTCTLIATRATRDTREPHVRAPLHHIVVTCMLIATCDTHEPHVRAPLHHIVVCYMWAAHDTCELYMTHVYVHCSPPPSKKSDRKTIRQPHR